MKKTVISIFLVLCAIVCLTSCKTIKGSQMNQISSEDLVINTYFDKDDFMIIGTAEGSSEFVYFDSTKKEYVGDSHKYGYVNDRVYANVDKDMYVGSGRESKSFYNPSTALETAKLNALYNLIVDAKALGGHFIFEPNYTVETQADPRGKGLMYKVTVTALVGKVFYY